MILAMICLDFEASFLVQVIIKVLLASNKIFIIMNITNFWIRIHLPHDIMFHIYLAVDLISCHKIFSFKFMHHVTICNRKGKLLINLHNVWNIMSNSTIIVCDHVWYGKIIILCINTALNITSLPDR